ncbi:MAG: hypothetical protein R3B84_23445 [Zavarzinella sp.]
MTREFDSPWKETLENYLPDIFEILFPQWYPTFDWAKGFRSLDTELRTLLPDSDSGMVRADALFEVYDLEHAGQTVTIFIHFEVQAQQDDRFPARMAEYYWRIRQKYGLNVSSFAILADENPNWRVDRNILSCKGTHNEFVFNSVKLLDFVGRMDDLTTHRSPVGLIVAASIQSLLTHGVAELRYADKCRLLRQLIERKLTADEVWNIMRLLDWLLKLPDELEEDFNKVRFDLLMENQMPFVTSFERLAEKKGIKIGEERGTVLGQRIGQIHAFEEILGLPITPVEKLQEKTLDELDGMITELKAKLSR